MRIEWCCSQNKNKMSNNGMRRGKQGREIITYFCSKAVNRMMANVSVLILFIVQSCRETCPEENFLLLPASPLLLCSVSQRIPLPNHSDFPPYLATGCEAGTLRTTLIPGLFTPFLNFHASGALHAQPPQPNAVVENQ